MKSMDCHADGDRHIRDRGAEVVPVDAEQTDAARRAWRRYGKGRHSAALNYGDCFSYALALCRGETLLFKGDDFAKTDINRRGEATLR